MKLKTLSWLGPVLSACAALAAFTWSYWPTFAELQNKWATDPLYSHGYLVPVFSGLLLWQRRRYLRLDRLEFTPWAILLIAGACALRLYGAYYYYLWLDFYSILPSLAGICILFFGVSILKYCWPSLVFLAYMMPLPYTIEMHLGYPLQQLATTASVYVLQTLGFPAIAEGNLISFNDTQIGIVEACSGLRMLVVFFAVATAVAFIIRRSLVQKLIIVVSAIPIALFTNVVRITTTGICHDRLADPAVLHFLHDFAGWLMMPVALALLGLELFVLSCAVTEEQPSAPLDFGPGSFAGAARS